MPRCRILTKEERRQLRTILRQSQTTHREFAGSLNGKIQYKKYRETSAECDANKEIVFHTHGNVRDTFFSDQDVVTALTCPSVYTDMLLTPDGITTLIKPANFTNNPPTKAAKAIIYESMDELTYISKLWDTLSKKHSMDTNHKAFRQELYTILEQRYGVKIRQYTKKAVDIEVCKHEPERWMIPFLKV